MAAEKGFIVYPTYRVENGKAYIYLFGRLESGKSFLTRNLTRPYFYIRAKDRKKAEAIRQDIKFDADETDLKNFYDDPVVKITLDIPGDVPKVRDYLSKEDIPTYEADIRFVYRYMIDKGIRGAMTIKGEAKKGEFTDLIFEEPELGPAEFRPSLKILALDVESSMDLKDLYCVSLYSHDVSKILFVGDKKISGAESFRTEKDMLQRLREFICEYDPDIITGWNLIDFDLKMLKEKFEKHNLNFTIGRTDWPVTLKVFESFFKESIADIPGRMALDAMNLLKINQVALRDYKLQTAAETILGESKLNVFEDLDKGAEIDRLYKEAPQKLADYNLQDSALVIKILDKLTMIDLIIQRSLLTGMQLDRVKASIASLDNLYLKEARKRGFVVKTSDVKDRDARIRGGFVRESLPGIYDYIDVLDFKSLYPSIIRTFNIDPLSFIPKELHGKYKESEVIVSPNGAWFRKQEGILPQIIEELSARRDDAKKRKNKQESYAIKITMNSFFGVLANPVCRFYSLDMANAITYFGQHIVKTTANIVEENGHKVIYGDTDSIFIQTKADSLEKAEALGKDTAKSVNSYWKDLVDKEFGCVSHLEIQFEKTFVRFLMPTIRGADIGAKKRYAGLRMIDGKEEIDFTGLEFVRRDWTELSKKFQLELLDRIFHKKEVIDFVKGFVNDLKKGKYDSLLIYRKAIRKGLAGYTKTTPPHVKAARKLPKITSNIISYVMTTDGPEPVQKITHALDYEHYIDKQIKPIADSVLGFYNQKFDDLLKNTKQTSLFGFGG